MFLVVCIILGGLSLMGHFAPQLIGMTVFHVAGYTITGGLIGAAILFYCGITAISLKH